MQQFTLIIWGSLLSVLCCGFLGTTIGITQAGLAIGDGKTTSDLAGGVQCPSCATLAEALGIAMTPGSYSLIIVFFLAVITGIIHYKIKVRRASGFGGDQQASSS